MLRQYRAEAEDWKLVWTGWSFGENSANDNSAKRKEGRAVQGVGHV